MFDVRQTETDRKWVDGLRDHQAVARIDARIRHVSLGIFGGAKTLGGGVSELRIDYGPGYRVYYARRGKAVILLLGGGDKRTQAKDIARAQALAKEV